MTDIDVTASPRPEPLLSEQSVGSRDLRRRLLRHYLPVAVASAVALVVFMNVGFFDANRKSPVAQPDIFNEGISGAWPKGELFNKLDLLDEQDPGNGQPQMQHGDSGEMKMPTTTTTTAAPGGGHVPRFQHGAGQGGPSSSEQGSGQSGGPPTASSGGNDQAQAGSGGHAGDFETVLRMRRLSFATGYIAFGLLGLTLLVGPVNLLRRRRTPLNSYLRRDVGIATAIGMVTHVVFGLLVKHGDGTILGYFFAPGDRSRILTTSFGLANWAGLAAVLIGITLLIISSDLALRKLKARRWKKIQRLNYALFGLVVVHALLYGALWRKTSPYTIMLGLILIAVLIAQAVGVRLWRRRKASVTAAAIA